jgi:hypothetical protein
MSHFAKVENGIVTQVIVAEQEFIDTLPDANTWIQTSYNTRGNVHYEQDGYPSGNTPLRGNFATIGCTYDAEHDVFYPQPIPNLNTVIFSLDTENWEWYAANTNPYNINSISDELILIALGEIKSSSNLLIGLSNTEVQAIFANTPNLITIPDSELIISTNTGHPNLFTGEAQFISSSNT